MIDREALADLVSEEIRKADPDELLDLVGLLEMLKAAAWTRMMVGELEGILLATRDDIRQGRR